MKRKENRLSNTQETPCKPSSKGTMLELMRYPNMRRKFCILTFLWLANSVAYNGLSYNSANLGVSDTLAFFINAIVEAPAYVLTWWAMGRWGRRWPVCLTMLLGGLACCCCMFVPEGKLIMILELRNEYNGFLDTRLVLDPLWISVTLAMIGKFGIAASFGIIFLYASELLPTVLRSQAMAIASFVAGIGLLAFPYIVFLVNPIEFSLREMMKKSQFIFIIFSLTGSVFTLVTHASYGRFSDSRCFMFCILTGNVRSQFTTNFGRRRSIWQSHSDLELSSTSKKVN